MTDKTLGAYQRHEKHDADHLASAEFARHPDGRTAMRSGPDLWKVNVRGEQYNSWYGTSTDMARDGWIPVRECPAPDDHTLAKGYPAMSDRATSWQERAEKAEKERDEARTVTDEMVVRGEAAYRKTGGYLSFRSVHLVLTAALTEPPARPEGAEEIERLIETSPWHLAGSCSAEADWLAEHGVRVVGEGGAA